MTNIIPFVSPTKHRESQTLSTHLRRADNIRNALRAGARFDSEDQVRVAQQIDRVLVEYKKVHRLSSTKVAREAGLGGNDNDDSSKRLDTYRLPANATEGRKRRIAKKPDRYFDLAKAIAQLTDESEDALLCHLFEGCSFGSAAEELPDWDTERWQILARLIEDMARAVVRDTALGAYWKDIARMDVEFDVRTGRFETTWGPCDTYPLRQGLPGGSVCSDETPPVPSISIARKLTAPAQSGTIVLDGGEEAELMFFLYLEMRLALGPTTSLTQIGPLIEFRSVLEAKDQEDRVITFDNPFNDGSYTLREMRRGDETFEVVQMPDLHFPESEWRDVPEHCYFAWANVSPALLREVLSDSDNPVEPARLETRFSNEKPPVRFEWGSAAAKLHGELLEGTLEDLLTEACWTLKEGFEAYQLKLRVRIMEAEAEARERWRRPSKMSEMKGETE